MNIVSSTIFASQELGNVLSLAYACPFLGDWLSSIWWVHFLSLEFGIMLHFFYGLGSEFLEIWFFMKPRMQLQNSEFFPSMFTLGSESKFLPLDFSYVYILCRTRVRKHYKYMYIMYPSADEPKFSSARLQVITWQANITWWIDKSLNQSAHKLLLVETTKTSIHLKQTIMHYDW